MKLEHWQFGFVLHTCRLGDSVRYVNNPFAGVEIEVPVDDGLNDSDRNGIRAVFASYGVQGPETEFEGYALYLPRNGSVRIRGGDLDQDKPPLTSFSVGIVVRQLSNEALGLVLDVARQGNLALMSSAGEPVIRLTKESSDPRIKRRWPDAGVIETTDALRSWLENQIGGDRVHLSQSR